MEYLKPLALNVVTISTIYACRSAFVRGPQEPLKLFILGVAASQFCRYVLPLRYSITSPWFAEWARIRHKTLELAKKRGDKEQLYVYDTEDMYGLEHMYLNLDLEPRTMWENMGYWKDAGGDFPTACCAIFEKLLEFSKALDKGPAAIVEIGCGCAETAIHLLNTRPEALDGYVGMNINISQSRFSATRLANWKARQEKQRATPAPGPRVVDVFQADAGLPSSWSKALTEAADSIMLGSDRKAIDHTQKWLLALDTLYHFDSGREGILTYAQEHWGTSLMAAEFLSPENLSYVQQLFLWVTLWAIQIPWKNRITRQQYTDMLVRCGYDPESIQITDITEYVFNPYADYIEQRIAQWELVGGTKAFALPFRLWGYIMRYWAWSGTLQSVLVVAHPQKK